MATVIQLKDADFSNQGLPNLETMVQKSALSYWYDLRNGNIKDQISNVTAKLWKTDFVAKTTVATTPDQILTQSADKLSVKVARGGTIATFKSTRDYALTTDKFTAMIIGGMGEGVSSSAPLLNFGNGMQPAGQIPSIEGSGTELGYRVKAGSGYRASSAITQAKLYFIVLVYDGTNFNFYNKTTGLKDFKTLASLAITSALTKITVPVDGVNHTFGNTHTNSTVADREIHLGQVAFWDNVAFTDAEVEQQYQNMKALYGSSI